MILAAHREGGIRLPVDARGGLPSFWRSLDRNISLGVKIIVPAIVITLVGTCGFGLLQAQKTNSEVEATYTTSASGAAEAAATAFYTTISDPTGVDQYLHDLVRSVPGAREISIVNVVFPGQPVVASSSPGLLGKTGLLDAGDVVTVEAGATTHAHHLVQGQAILETVAPVTGNAFGVVVITSLAGEDQVLRSNVTWSLIAATVISALELGAMVLLLETGMFRRIRRSAQAIDTFGATPAPVRLSEGNEPHGRDALFNLARSIDLKLGELSERKRVGSVISEMGLMTMQGARPEELTRKALALVSVAANLQQCFLVMAGDWTAVVDSYEKPGSKSTTGKLPIWIVSLARAARLARRPVLADRFGEGCRYWTPESGQGRATAAFVPVAGSPDPIGIIVAIAREGSAIDGVNLPLLEGVATALGESLQRREAETARQESEAKSRALHSVSHEIRNPLNAMLGFSELLLSGAAGPLTPKQEAYMRKVDDGSHLLLRLVNDYLDLAKVLSGSLPVQAEAVVVANEVRSVVELMQPTADAKGVTVRAEVPPSLIARADALRVRQVIMNLISNAIKFTPSGGHVRIEVAGGSNGVRISVIDTGIGIPAAKQHLVFTEFSQFGPSNGQGTGLGLALSKRLVEAMGGFIRFTSAEGAGTIFDVWLPGEQSPVAASVPAAALAG